VTVSNIDRLVLAGLYRLAPEVPDALKVLKPETVIRWQRAGLRTWRRWKSLPRGDRPRTPAKVRQLIREMSIAHPLWELCGSTANCSSSESMLARPR